MKTYEDAIRAQQYWQTFFFDRRITPQIAMVGSCYINNKGKDIDLLVRGDRNKIFPILIEEGFKQDGEYIGEEFTSLRAGDVNIILTESVEYYKAFTRAAEVCYLISNGDLAKAHRVAIHEIIINGVDRDTAEERAQRFLD